MLLRLKSKYVDGVIGESKWRIGACLLISLCNFIFFYCRTRWVITVESQLPRLGPERETSDRCTYLTVLCPFPDVPPLKFNCEEAKGQPRTDACALFYFLWRYLLFFVMTNVSWLCQTRQKVSTLLQPHPLPSINYRLTPVTQQWRKAKEEYCGLPGFY